MLENIPDSPRLMMLLLFAANNLEKENARDVITFIFAAIARKLSLLFHVFFTAMLQHQGGDTRIPLTRWSVGHVWQDKHHSGRFFVFIRQYARICLYKKRHDLGQNPNELLVTSLVCKVGLFYSSVSINQLFNTKNSFLQLFSRKSTLKYEVLFKSVFFTNFFTWNCSKKC